MLISTLLILIGLSHVTGSHLLVLGCPLVFELEGLSNTHGFPLLLYSYIRNPLENFLHSGSGQAREPMEDCSEHFRARLESSKHHSYPQSLGKNLISDPTLSTKEISKTANVPETSNTGEHLARLTTHFFGPLI